MQTCPRSSEWKRCRRYDRVRLVLSMLWGASRALAFLLFCFFLSYILRRTSHPFSFPLFPLYSFPLVGWSVTVFEYSDMPGFLRRKTSPSKTVDTETPSKKSSSSDAPPSLPPLFPSRTSHTSSFRKEPESDMAPVSSPSQPGPLKENGTAGDSVLLPDITPLHSSLDVDTDWQDLLRFIDSPSLLADSSQETKPSTASEKHKRSSTPGVALVTSNRYLSNAQKTRMAQERGLKLSDSAGPPRRVSPHGDRLKKDECEDVSKSNHATSGSSSVLLSANHANPLRHRISSIMEDQQDATTNENERVGTANVSTYKEPETSKRREGAQGPQAPAAQLKFEASADPKSTRKDSKTSRNGNGSFFSKSSRMTLHFVNGRLYFSPNPR
ncbi:hypothetical protein BKA83DRAFT_4340766 [Pisolithus microcarpus]|nr:hypothetical protein BKA83DRAFT_4340766 [Pisolithus microcarpus]